jgi:hypothetical protein
MADVRVDEPDTQVTSAETVRLLWIPLGVGASVVRRSGSAFEAIVATVRRRQRFDLYHSALEVSGPDHRWAIEMAPVIDQHGERRGVVAGGTVGSVHLSRLRVFRYEIRRMLDGAIPDRDAAVGGPITVSRDAELAQRLIDLVPEVPTPVWGRDELRTGEMWNSNSVTSWLLASAGIDLDHIRPPAGGRAPGWDAGRAVASRSPAPAGSGRSSWSDRKRDLYQNGRPTDAAKVIHRRFAAGPIPRVVPVACVLEVVGRRSGTIARVPLVIIRSRGSWYLVSMFGSDANWVRNLRVAGGRASLLHGRRRRVRLVEVPVHERPLILKRYLLFAMGARPHVPVHWRAPISEFEAIAADFPVFRVQDDTS